MRRPQRHPHVGERQVGIPLHYPVEPHELVNEGYEHPIVEVRVEIPPFHYCLATPQPLLKVVSGEFGIDIGSNFSPDGVPIDPHPITGLQDLLPQFDPAA